MSKDEKKPLMDKVKALEYRVKLLELKTTVNKWRKLLTHAVDKDETVRIKDEFNFTLRRVS